MRYEKRRTFTEYFLCIFLQGGGDIRMRGARNGVASIQGHGNLLHAGDSTSDVSPAFYYPLTSQSRVPQMRYKMSPASTVPSNAAAAAAAVARFTLSDI